MDKVAILAIVSALVVAECNGVIWKDCGSKEGKIKTVSIPGCEKTPTCVLHKGTNVTFNVEFIPNEAITKATAVVHGVIAGIPIPFPIDNPDGCKDSGLTCPVKSGSDSTYSSTLAVKSAYPSVKVTVEWQLNDQSGNAIFCVKLPAQISSAKKADKLYFNPRN